MSAQANSDPLPYVQVDRAVKPKAALLAQYLHVTTQHAVGSLVEFWDLCGDPRDLERIVVGTPAGQEPAVVLGEEELCLRFLLASGAAVPAEVMVQLGLVARVGEASKGQYRVRGMSRYFEPIVRRIQARAAAKQGGKRSAEVRKASYGTGQPVSAAAEADVEATPEATPEAAPKRLRSDHRSGAEAVSNPSGQRSAVSRGRGSTPSPPSNSAGPAGEGSNKFQVDLEAAWTERQVREFILWAEPHTENAAGPQVWEWARYNLRKYRDHRRAPGVPADVVACLRGAFLDFLAWTRATGKLSGWGLWLEDAVWHDRLMSVFAGEIPPAGPDDPVPAEYFGQKHRRTG